MMCFVPVAVTVIDMAFIIGIAMMFLVMTFVTVIIKMILLVIFLSFDIIVRSWSWLGPGAHVCFRSSVCTPDFVDRSIRPTHVFLGAEFFIMATTDAAASVEKRQAWWATCPSALLLAVSCPHTPDAVVRISLFDVAATCRLDIKLLARLHVRQLFVGGDVPLGAAQDRVDAFGRCW